MCLCQSVCFPLQGLTDTEADLSSMGSRPASRQVSCDISRDTAELPDFKPSSSFKSKMKSNDSGIFEKVNDSAIPSIFQLSKYGLKCIRTCCQSNKSFSPKLHKYRVINTVSWIMTNASSICEHIGVCRHPM